MNVAGEAQRAHQEPAALSPYMTIDETAGYLRLSINTIRALRRKGELPPSYGLPGRPVYRKADLDRWVLSRPQTVARRRKAGL